jgi:hypothetical protein
MLQTAFLQALNNPSIFNTSNLQSYYGLRKHGYTTIPDNLMFHSYFDSTDSLIKTVQTTETSKLKLYSGEAEVSTKFPIAVDCGYGQFHRLNFRTDIKPIYDSSAFIDGISNEISSLV